MSPVRRTALVSVVAAAVLIALKLGVGLAANSLGLVSEAMHSGTDLVAALLTFFALGVAHRPADSTHPWGHGKAEHLAALAECAILVLASILIGVAAVGRLASGETHTVATAWWSFAVIGVVIVIDCSRMLISHRAARRHNSAALASNALHFAGDLAGTVAVLIGLIMTRAGYPAADAIAALFVGVLVLAAATRLAHANVNVLMDSSSREAEDAARDAIERLGPDIQLDRLRVREAGGTHFADAVIAVSPSAALAEGHAAADAVEDAIAMTLPGADIVVHVEPGRAPQDLRERALAAALAVPGVREIHNVRVVHPPGRTEISLHMKLPAQMRLTAAHDLAHRVEDRIRAALPEVHAVATHMEPLDSPLVADGPPDEDQAACSDAVRQAVVDLTGRPPNDLRLVRGEDGVTAFLAIAVDGALPLDEAHAIAGALRSRLRREQPELEDVFVHTEPAGEDHPPVDRHQNRSVR